MTRIYVSALRVFCRFAAVDMVDIVDGVDGADSVVQVHSALAPRP